MFPRTFFDRDTFSGYFCAAKFAAPTRFRVNNSNKTKPLIITLK